MEWLFCINPNIAIGLACALGCAACLRICADEVRTLLAWRRANAPTRRRASHMSAGFAQSPRYTPRTSAPARPFAPAYAQHAPSSFSPNAWGSDEAA